MKHFLNVSNEIKEKEKLYLSGQEFIPGKASCGVGIVEGLSPIKPIKNRPATG
jgi:hypothetical protein